MYYPWIRRSNSIYIFVIEGLFNEVTNNSERQGMGKEANSLLCPRSIKRKRKKNQGIQAVCRPRFEVRPWESEAGVPTARPGTSGVKVYLENKPVLV